MRACNIQEVKRQVVNTVRMSPALSLRMKSLRFAKSGKADKHMALFRR